MTNEEAIKEIQDASDYEVRHGDIEHHYEDIMRRVEAFEKAVNALQKEPVYFPPCVDCNTKMNEIREAYDNLKKKEPCEDAVSRQAVLKEIPVLWNGNGDKDYCMETLRDFVVEMPAVEPTREPSEWQQDHEILKAHADGANEVIDRIKKAREEVANYSDFHREHLYKTNPNYDVEQGQYLAYEKCLQIIDDMIAEVEG